MIDYKEKIRKLLALSQSPVKAEATAALLKARELMVKHKIESADLEQKKEQSIVRHDIKEIRYFSRKDAWIDDLLQVINDEFPVLATVCHYRNEKSYFPVISGFESDVEVVVNIIRYIVDSVHSWSKEYCKNNRVPKGKHMTFVTNGFGFGFIHGWTNALVEQKEANPEWGLVLVTPDVSSVVKPKGKYEMNMTNGYNLTAYAQGTEAGYQYGSQKRLDVKLATQGEN